MNYFYKSYIIDGLVKSSKYTIIVILNEERTKFIIPIAKHIGES